VTMSRHHYLPELVQYSKAEGVNLDVPMGPGIIDYDSFTLSRGVMGSHAAAIAARKA